MEINIDRYQRYVNITILYVASMKIVFSIYMIQIVLLCAVNRVVESEAILIADVI